MTTLSVVIPAYNEQDGIADIAQRVLSVRDALINVGVKGLELLVVDDGSKDQTASIASDIDGVTLIRHKRNKGYGAALKTGFHAAQGDLIGFLDADGTYPPENFPELCVAAMNGSDIVIGSRMAGADSQMPITRRVGNLFFANLLSLLGRQSVSDSASGMRVFKRHVLEMVSPLPDGLNLTPVMSTRAVHENVAIKEIPIPYSERVGASKLSVVRDGQLFLSSMVWTALTYNPVRVLGLIGFICLVLASAVGVGLIATRLSGVTELNAWGVSALYAALVAAVIGVSLISLGAMFNYLVRFFHKRPIKQGFFGRSFFNGSADRHFGWIGGLLLIAGIAVAIASMSLGISGWAIERIWLYLLGSAMSILVGVQLIIGWIVMRVLDDLSERSASISGD